MKSQDQIPLMLQFLFGDTARVVGQAASPRLLAWCQAFDE